MTEQRPSIPLPIQREVRQRCGFGCVVCGFPLYEYHHIIPYSETKQHTASNLTLLCDLHHKEITNGLLTARQVSAANQKPHNVTMGISSPYNLHFSGEDCKITIGGNTFYSGFSTGEYPFAMIPVSIDDIDIIAFGVDHHGNLFLHANILDEYNRLILEIAENTLIYRSDTWDIQFKGKMLTIREAARNIFFDIEFQPPNTINIPRGRLLCNGVEVLVRSNHIFVVNAPSLFVGNEITGKVIGLQIGRNARNLPAAFGLPSEAVSRYLLPREEVERIEREQLKHLQEVIEEFKNS